MNHDQIERAWREGRLVVALIKDKYLVGHLASRSGSFFGFRGIGGKELSPRPASAFSLYQA